MKNQLRTLYALAALALLSLVVPRTALAVDGQIAITQAKAMAGGVTPGDAPGFPVTISQPGSYVLSGILTVPDADTDAITINADHVTLDLNGFAILGPTNCSGELYPCAGAGSGNGITTTGGYRFNITIRNGTIQGMGSQGILLFGDSHLVEYMHVRSNGATGIVISESADRGGNIVQRNTVQRNGAFGISTSGIVADNIVNLNGDSGIFTIGGTVSKNVVTRNGAYGIFIAGLGGSSYIGNVISENGFGYSPVVGVPNLGQNLCDTLVCPGAAF